MWRGQELRSPKNIRVPSSDYPCHISVHGFYESHKSFIISPLFYVSSSLGSGICNKNILIQKSVKMEYETGK